MRPPTRTNSIIPTTAPTSLRPRSRPKTPTTGMRTNLEVGAHAELSLHDLADVSKVRRRVHSCSSRTHHLNPQSHATTSAAVNHSPNCAIVFVWNDQGLWSGDAAGMTSLSFQFSTAHLVSSCMLRRVSSPRYIPAVRTDTTPTVQYNNTIQHNTTQHNTTQHNTTQHNTTQHNTTQHNTTQHNTAQQHTHRDTARHSHGQQRQQK